MQFPQPPRLEDPVPARSLPEEIVLESRRDLEKRLLRAFPLVALTLVPLWYLLLFTYVVSTGPFMWFISPLVALSEPDIMSQLLLMTGFSGTGLVLSFLLLPWFASAASLLAIPLASRWVGRLNPQLFLTEEGFQKAVSMRAALPLLLPPALAVGALLLAVPLGLSRHWNSLSYGIVAGFAVGLLALLIALPLLRRALSAQRLLGIPTAATLGARQFGLSPERRQHLMSLLRAEDGRTLPPASEHYRPIHGLRAVAVVAWAAVPWVIVPTLVMAWMVFLVADVSVVLGRLGDYQTLNPVASGLPWTVWVTGIAGLLLLTLAVAVMPMLAMSVSRSQRSQVRSFSTPTTWSQRRENNPWEARIAMLTALGVTAAGFGIVLVMLVVTFSTGAGSSMVGFWAVLAITVLLPLLAAATHQGMREHLRYVLYGPAGHYARRDVLHTRVVPVAGTRTSRAGDPEVRGEIRRREEAAARAQLDAAASPGPGGALPDLRRPSGAGVPMAGGAGAVSAAGAGVGTGAVSTGGPGFVPGGGAAGHVPVSASGAAGGVTGGGAAGAAADPWGSERNPWTAGLPDFGGAGEDPILTRARRSATGDDHAIPEDISALSER
ncbi:MAG: hypothetical protein Q4G40_04415 [Brachybacterium sp.]|nr:hypothetical protein [Brachybacterium sp.]